MADYAQKGIANPPKKLYKSTILCYKIIRYKIKNIQDDVAITIHFIFLYRKQEDKMMSSDKQLCVHLFDLDIMHDILINLQFILK